MASPKAIDPAPDPLRADLETLRSGLLESFAAADHAVKAQIAGQLRQVVKDLAALGPSEGKKSVADEIAARRATKSAGAPSSGRRSQPRRGAGHNRTG